MADCASLLDEELSSFVFNYLTENSGSQYGEEEVCSDRLDADFPDIDLSQLDASDFDSVNCLSELHWCNDQASDGSPASIHYSTADEFFEIEEENAALLAALTDSLDGMVDAEVGGLSVFPNLEEGPDQEEEEDDDLPLDTRAFNQSLGSDTEDPSLLKKLLLSPPTGIDAHKDGSHGHRHSNRSLLFRPVRPLVKSDVPQERKPRAVRPAGRLCTELHRHLTTAQDAAEDTPTPDTEDEEDEDEDSESEEEEGEEEEEDESSSSEVESSAVAAAAPVEPAKPQFSSEKELHSVVELIRYMHTYCLPTRKQHGWDRKDLARKARPEAARLAAQNCHSKVVVVGAPGTGGSSAGAGGSGGGGGGPPRRLPFARRREMKANSLLRELLEQSSSFDVSKPYRLHSPPYSHTTHSLHRGAPAPPPLAKPAPAQTSSSTPTAASRQTKSELRKDSSSSPERRTLSSSSSFSSEVPQSPEEATDDFGSFSVRRSRRLASFPSRFAKRLRSGRARGGEGMEREREVEEDRAGVKHPSTQAGGTRTEPSVEQLTPSDGSPGQTPAEPAKLCCHNEKRACLCLPLNSKPTGESQYGTKPFEQTLNVDLCGTAGLTPPTTPPHKPVEDELFKPAEGGKGGGGGGGGGGESPHPTTNTTKSSSSWLSRAHHQRKFPEQTELYAQLRRMGQANDSESLLARGGAVVHRTFGDHDYCVLSLGESRKRSTAMLGAVLRTQEGEEALRGGSEGKGEVGKGKEGETPLVLTAESPDQQQQMTVMSPSLASNHQSAAATPPASEEEGERSSSSRSPSPVLHSSPNSPASKTDSSSENSESCPEDKQRNKAMSGQQKEEDNCQVFYIHNLPTSVTQSMLRKRFQAFGNPDDCKVIIRNEERCGVIKIRPGGGQGQRHRREREAVFLNGISSLRRLTRKRYIDLDEAGPGPVKSKYDALDFDTLLKEAQKSLHR